MLYLFVFRGKMSGETPIFNVDKSIDYIAKRVSKETITTQENLIDIMAEENGIFQTIKNLTHDIKEGTLFYDAEYPELNQFLAMLL